MPGIRLINVFDVSRSLGKTPFEATPETVAKWLLTEYLPKRGGQFNYDPATRWTFELFRGSITAEQAIHYCATSGNPFGRRHNAAAIGMVAQYALSNISNCYRIAFTAVEAGRVQGQTVYIGIKAPMVRVRGRDAFVVVPGFRMSHRPVEIEIDVACSIVLAHLARDDYSAADFEYLYAGPDKSGTREFRAILGRDRQTFDRDTVDALLDVYVKGIVLAVGLGADLRPPKLAGYRVVDRDQPSMF
jgi:hypothetical protein